MRQQTQNLKIHVEPATKNSAQMNLFREEEEKKRSNVDKKK